MLALVCDGLTADFLVQNIYYLCIISDRSSTDSFYTLYMASPKKPPLDADSDTDDDGKLPSLEDVWQGRVSESKKRTYFPHLFQQEQANNNSISTQNDEPAEKKGRAQSSTTTQKVSDTNKQQGPTHLHNDAATEDKPEPKTTESGPKLFGATPKAFFTPGRLALGSVPHPEPVPKRPSRPLQPGRVQRN